MKKTAIVFLVLLTICAAVFAADKEPVVRYDLDPNYALDFTFQPTLSRYNAMGQSGLALPTRIDSFFTNPAALSSRGFGISFPSVTVTVYNLDVPPLVPPFTAKPYYSTVHYPFPSNPRRTPVYKHGIVIPITPTSPYTIQNETLNY